MRRIVFLISVPLFLLSACATEQPLLRHTHERLHGTLYLQRSAEHQAVCVQTFRTATERLAAALADPAWSAERRQTGDLSALPPAVVLDIDETVLDNSPYYAWMVRNDTDFDLKQWNRWVVRAEAELLSGVADFIAAAEKAGVTVFFVTNRDARLEGHTRLNLERRGIALDKKIDTLLMLNERPEWKDDKGSRRAFIARTHRIIMLFGDHLNDFLPMEGLDEQARKQLVTGAAAYWGTRWFALPNPLYGSWVDEIAGAVRDDAAVLKLKYDALRPAAVMDDETAVRLRNEAIQDFPRQLFDETPTIIVPADPAPQPAAEEIAPAAPEDPAGG